MAAPVAPAAPAPVVAVAPAASLPMGATPSGDVVADFFRNGTALKLVLVKALELKNAEGVVKTLQKLHELALTVGHPKLIADTKKWLERTQGATQYDAKFHNSMYCEVAKSFTDLLKKYSESIPKLSKLEKHDVASRSKVVQLYITELFALKTKILEGVDARSVQTVLAKAHKLKNSSRLIGAIRVQSIACDIEAFMRAVKRGEGVFDATLLLECILQLTLEAGEICNQESAAIPALNREILEQSTMGDVEFSRQMMSMFCTEVVQSHPTLLQAIKRSNCKTILRTCHKLKGSSKMLGAIRMQFSLNNWEEATKPAFKSQVPFSVDDATKLCNDIYLSLINLMESCSDLITPELLAMAKKAIAKT